MGCTSDKMVPPTMTDTEKETITQSWSKFKSKGDLADLGLPMFNKLFDENPDLRLLYSFMRDENENNDEKLRNHAKGVMEVVDVAVSGIHNLTELHPVLVDLGVRHYRYGVKKSDMKPLGKCLMYALEKQLAGEFESDVQNSWIKFFSVLSIGFSQGIDNADKQSIKDGET